MRIISVVLVLSLGLACTAAAAENTPPPQAVEVRANADGTPLHEVAMVARLLDRDLGDGFDFAVGNREGKGGDASQAVRAIADGKVLRIDVTEDGAAVQIEHRFLDNGRVRFVRSTTADLQEIAVVAGDRVKRRQKLGRMPEAKRGAPTQVRLTLIAEGVGEGGSEVVVESPAAFIRDHRRLLIPARMDSVVLAIKQEYRLHYCEKGKIVKTFPMALGQSAEGHKTGVGDNCTPEGEYRIIQKALGPFDGKVGEFLGAAWMRLSYPNAADARTAFAEGGLTARECASLVAAQAAGRMPSGETRLGGGIGIHGWAFDWPDGPQNLTWGCLSLRKADLLELYGLVKKGTVVVIHP